MAVIANNQRFGREAWTEELLMKYSSHLTSRYKVSFHGTPTMKTIRSQSFQIVCLSGGFMTEVRPNFTSPYSPLLMTVANLLSTDTSILACLSLSFTTPVITRTGYRPHREINIPGLSGLPRIAMKMPGKRKVFTSSPCIWKTVNTFNIVFPILQRFRSLDTGLYSTMSRWLTRSIQCYSFL